MARSTETGTIELRVDRIAQLFNSLDPSPFRERDLDSDAAQHIIASAREIDGGGRLHIVVHLPRSELESTLAAEITPAMTYYFAHRADAEGSTLRELTRDGRRALAIGMLILAASLAAMLTIRTYVPLDNLARLAEESLIILGWVGIWGPLDILLFDRLPIVRRRRLYRRLADARVELRGVESDRRAD